MINYSHVGNLIIYQKYTGIILPQPLRETCIGCIFKRSDKYGESSCLSKEGTIFCRALDKHQHFLFYVGSKRGF